jgi:DNA transformation protein
MSVSGDHLAWIVDQLAELGPVTARRMFGGAGLYLDGVMFGIVMDDACFLRVDDSSRDAFVSRGCVPFEPKPGTLSTSYYAVPDDVLEDPGELAQWARRAVAAAASR